MPVASGVRVLDAVSDVSHLGVDPGPPGADSLLVLLERPPHACSQRIENAPVSGVLELPR